MKRFILLLVLFDIFCFLSVYGQENEDYVEQQVNKIIPASPNASSLGIYGNTPVGYYTGVPEIKIPIYDLETRGFTLPIALSYHASGIKVAQEASSVGLGWALNAGGCIVREIKHKDDFASGGYYSDFSFPENDSYNDAVDPQNTRFSEYLNNTYDSEPDIFNYNFNNMSGSFFFERDKDSETNVPDRAEAIISNKNTWLKITYHKFYDEGYFGRFEIADAYGNVYFFGSRENARTYTCNLTEFPGEEYIDRYHQEFVPKSGNDFEVTTAWYLDKIITAKKDTVTFEYEKERILSSVGISEDVSQLFSIYQTTNRSNILPPNSFKYYYLNYTDSDQQLLKKISFNRGEIDFFYTDRLDIESSEYNKKAKKIDRLIVKNRAADTILNVKFDYSYMGTPLGNDNMTMEEKELTALNCRLMLDSMTIYRNDGCIDQKYIFSYNDSLLPRKNSSNTDHWGYYNENSEIQPDQIFYYTPSYSCSYTDLNNHLQTKLWVGVNKNPCVSRCQYGTLTSIEYPTGGRTIFEYELNDFDNGFRDSVDSLIKSGGGLRVKTIYDLSAAADTISVRSFTYKENGASSGVLMIPPLYHYIFELGQATGDITLHGVYINGASNSYRPITGSAAGMNVGYSYVEEKNITHGIDNGYIAYRFMNHPDQLVDLEDKIIRNYPSIPQMDNGSPVDIIYYDNQNNPVKSIHYSYQQVERNSIKGLMCYLPPMAQRPIHIKFYDVYSERWVLDSKTETSFFSGSEQLCISTEYDYDDVNWLQKYELQRITNGENNDFYSITHVYPTEYSGTYADMINENMIGVPIEITKRKNGNIISSNKITYSKVNNTMYLPKTYSTLDTNTKEYYTQLTIDDYDPYGNIRQFTMNDNMPVSYIWSYNNEYPVLEIKNATYSQVVKALGLTALASIKNYDGGDLSVKPDFHAYSAILRNNLPFAHVSVYTYKPLVGCTSITDPSGRTMHYEYDAANRLSEIKDDQNEGNIIQKYEYHYKNGQ